MACSKQVKNVKVFSFLNLLQGRYLIIKKYSFYFTLLSQSVLNYEHFKNTHFCGQIDNFVTSIAIFNLDTWNFKTKH